MTDRVFSVRASALNLRAGPSTAATRVALLQRGQLVARLDLVDRDGWWRVFADTPGEGAYMGYVAARWLAPWRHVASQAQAAPSPPARADTAPAPTPQSAPPLEAQAMTLDGFKAAADRLDVGAAELWTVLEVETRGEGYFVGGAKHRLPQILFERHIFSQRTNHAFDTMRPDLSARRPYTAAADAPEAERYGGHDLQYPRLVAAARLNARAALESASWGLGQIMGFNHAAAGYDDVEAMVDDMRRSEDRQLAAFVGFLEHHALKDKLRDHRWAEFAEVYNGKNYAAHDYHGRLAAKYDVVKRRRPDILLREAQVYLKFIGLYGQRADGLWGPATRAAIARYLSENGDPDAVSQLTERLSDDLLRTLVDLAGKDARRVGAQWPLDAV